MLENNYIFSSFSITQELKATPKIYVNDTEWNVIDAYETLYYMVNNAAIERNYEFCDENFTYYTLWNRHDNCWWKIASQNPQEGE